MATVSSSGARIGEQLPPSAVYVFEPVLRRALGSISSDTLSASMYQEENRFNHGDQSTAVEFDMKRFTSLSVIGLNVVATVLTAAVVGPSVGKLENVLGLVGWAARAPFYLLPLYLSPLVIWLRPTAGSGTVLGVLVAVPLVFWSIATKCPTAVPVTYLVSGTIQGALLGWLIQREA